jgi:hypothetical protein
MPPHAPLAGTTFKDVSVTIGRDRAAAICPDVRYKRKN